jgi:predicted nucleotidyltransferase
MRYVRAVSESRDAQFQHLVEDAANDGGVVGLFVFGSRSRSGFADEVSDYDVAVILADDAALSAFDERWPYAHGSAVEVVTATLAQFKQHAEIGTASEWARYQYAHLAPLIDKTGEVGAILRSKERIPEPVVRDYAAAALGGYINSTYRSMRARMVNVERAARFDAAESIPYLLTAIFALEGRVKPFNKYLEWELVEHPLDDPKWSAENLMPMLDKVIAGDLTAQQELFREVERASRLHGHDEAIDEWQPDLEWLRGDGPYRPAKS